MVFASTGFALRFISKPSLYVGGDALDKSRVTFAHRFLPFRCVQMIFDSESGISASNCNLICWAWRHFFIRRSTSTERRRTHSPAIEIQAPCLPYLSVPNVATQRRGSII